MDRARASVATRSTASEPTGRDHELPPLLTGKPPAVREHRPEGWGRPFAPADPHLC